MSTYPPHVNTPALYQDLSTPLEDFQRYVSVPFYASTPKASLGTLINKSDIKALFIGKLEQWGDRAEVIPNTLNCIRFPHYEGNAKVDIGQEWDALVAANEAATENPH